MLRSYACLAMRGFALALPLLALGVPFASAAEKEQVIPHAQSEPPGPALTPEEAIAKMTVPEGFSVELVVAEPELMNPVAMAFDARGRIWVTESFEYPRKEAGEGRDRIKILEDTDGDGRIDDVKIFAEGLNIPSGIAIGYGGVWVANAPDILFLKDTNGDDVADEREVVVTGFGRDDTHELPNSLTWGPDGYLYGLNGVFNPAHVTSDGKTYDFTCALFRIDPRTRRFELFAEGTSNPWGVAWDHRGSAFLSACVIDHLWHLTETGYYHRQGGPYPPNTWKIESIVDFKHQKAAYCGIHYFDSDAYPEEYRDRLYMGNIHGGCINVDTIEKRGSTYRGGDAPDFLSAHDAWFMPIVQKTGPDGCLYVLDWYDRYHCYQDANRDPEGIDRGKGRLYRIRYRDTPRAAAFDLESESDDELIARLQSPNVFYRDLAQRILAERGDDDRKIGNRRTDMKLEALALDAAQPLKYRMHALWARVSGAPVSEAFLNSLLDDKDETVRAWGVRTAGDHARRYGVSTPALAKRIAAAATDEAADVRLQAIIAAPKIDGVDPMQVALTAAQGSPDDVLIPHIAWNAIKPRLQSDPGSFAAAFRKIEQPNKALNEELLPRAMEIAVTSAGGSVQALADLFAIGWESPAARPAAERCLSLIAQKLQSGEIRGETAKQVRAAFEEPVKKILSANDVSENLKVEATLLAATWGEPDAFEQAMQWANEDGLPRERQRAALYALTASNSFSKIDWLTDSLIDPNRPAWYRQEVANILAERNDPGIAKVFVQYLGQQTPDVQVRWVDLLTRRPEWIATLVDAVEAERVPKALVSQTQLLQIRAITSPELAARVEAVWGTIRESRDPARDLVIARMRRELRAQTGDPHKGQQVFAKVCGQCHKIHGQGEEVGPDVTRNGRASFEQLLSNVFDPSLVIGPGYQSVTVLTADGRALTGLVMEESPQRIVLKLQGGKQAIVPAGDIETVKKSELSLMPQNLDEQITREEMKDLFAFLSLDRPPSDAQATWIPDAEPKDLAKLSLPARATNALATAKLDSNVDDFGAGTRGKARDLIYLPNEQRFAEESQWHEWGVPSQRDLGVRGAEDPIYLEATWDQPVAIDTIVLSGCYPNQPQPNTAWKVEALTADGPKVLDAGVGGWVSAGRFLWGGPANTPIQVRGVRVSLFSGPDGEPVKSLHFRGEPGVSWFMGEIPEAETLFSESAAAPAAETSATK